MKESQNTLFSYKRVGLMVVLSGAFHLFMAWVLLSHVPSEAVFWQWIWALFAAAPLAGTFFLASGAFSQVLLDQLSRKKSA